MAKTIILLCDTLETVDRLSKAVKTMKRLTYVKRLKLYIQKKNRKILHSIAQKNEKFWPNNIFMRIFGFLRHFTVKKT